MSYSVTKWEKKTKKITKKELAKFVVEARIYEKSLDLYAEDSHSNFLKRVGTLDAPNGITDPEELLEYARKNLPKHLDLT